MPLEGAGISFLKRPGSRGLWSTILHTRPHGEPVEPWATDTIRETSWFDKLTMRS